MKKHLLIIFSFITLHTHAMDKKNWFIGLPTEVTDLIADLLFVEIEETEEEFVARTKALKTTTEIPQKYLSHLEIDQVDPNHHISFLPAYCPNNKIIALHKKEQFGRIKPTLFIIDTLSNQLLHKTILESINIAISRNGNIIGTIHVEQNYEGFMKQKFFGGEKQKSFKNILSILHSSTANKIKIYEIPDYFDLSHQHPAIAFNKQGTLLIVHGNNNDLLYHSPLSFDEIEKNPIRHHMIIPLTKNTPHPHADTKKTLARYCAQQGICKDFNKQLTLTR